MSKNSYKIQKSLNCKGELILLDTPKIMGIINLSPNSFYHSVDNKDEKAILSLVEKHLNEGATFIDIGACSSAPGRDYISEEEELKILIEKVDLICKTFPNIKISIDTFRAKVAKESIEAGASIINDISAGNIDKDMLPTAAKLCVPYILMHMQGTSKTMQNNPIYKDLIKDITLFFSKKINILKDLAANDIIIDPGFGFGKTIDDNFKILKNLDYFKIFEYPIMAGISRKSMIYKTLKTTAKHSLNGTSILNTIAIIKGVDIIRVHDVKEAMEAIKLTNELN